MAPGHQWQAFDTDGGRDNGAPRRHGLVGLDARSAADTKRHDINHRVVQIRPYIIDEASEFPRQTALERVTHQARIGLAPDDYHTRIRAHFRDRRPDLVHEPPHAV